MDKKQDEGMVEVRNAIINSLLSEIILPYPRQEIKIVTILHHVSVNNAI